MFLSYAFIAAGTAVLFYFHDNSETELEQFYGTAAKFQMALQP